MSWAHYVRHSLTMADSDIYLIRSYPQFGASQASTDTGFFGPHVPVHTAMVNEVCHTWPHNLPDNILAPVEILPHTSGASCHAIWFSPAF